MGLLDDAIREHLDLKRRRGSDPAEIARLEQEALGPVRREPEPAAADDEPVVEQAAAAEERHDEPAPPTKPEPTLATEEPDAKSDPRESDVVDQPTTEFRVEDHHDEADREHPEPPAEDVLEETPDFLQETPEHDRLWFEQRPPRDFDFDD